MSNISQTAAGETGVDSSLIDSDDVQGTSVFDPAGKHIGTIQRLVIDKMSGQVVYTVAQFGGFLGLGSKEYTIPWAKLDYDTAVGGFRTDVTEEQIKNAPAFDDETFVDRSSEEELNSYYGAANYWDRPRGM